MGRLFTNAVSVENLFGGVAERKPQLSRIGRRRLKVETLVEWEEGEGFPGRLSASSPLLPKARRTALQPLQPLAPLFRRHDPAFAAEVEVEAFGEAAVAFGVFDGFEVGGAQLPL